MRSPSSHTRRFHDYPISSSYVLDRAADREDFGTAFVAGYGGGGGGAEGGCEGGESGVGSLQLVYVGGVYGGGEEAEG